MSAQTKLIPLRDIIRYIEVNQVKDHGKHIEDIISRIVPILNNKTSNEYNKNTYNLIQTQITDEIVYKKIEEYAKMKFNIKRK